MFSANYNSKNACLPEGLLLTPPVSVGTSVLLEANGYILELPSERTYYGVRSLIRKSTMKTLLEGATPTWKAFFIDDPNEEIFLTSSCECATTKSQEEFRKSTAANLQPLLPPTILLKTDILTGGPQVVREFALIPGADPKLTGSGVRFTWRRTTYTEETSEFGREPWCLGSAGNGEEPSLVR
jgi:hypothetical protein